jgi:GrpB-like predicted nucleotidyltransferase (UPF0157 family)
LRPEIVGYRPVWPEEFTAIATRLSDALGLLALRVDHIGSTSVPGLCAKDVIDVQVTVAGLDEAAISSALVPLGFVQRPFGHDHVPPGSSEDEAEWAKLFFNAPAGAREANVHVRIDGRANQRYAILFRDYLRTHPDAASAYGELKRRLATVCDDTGVYADIKDPVCDIIMQAAEVWADRTGWRSS